MKKYWDKIELYIISLWLLFLLIFIITIKVPMYLGSDWQFVEINKLFMMNLIPIISIFLLILGVFFYFRFGYKLKGSKEIPFEITQIENINYEHLTFLTTYIIPLICFDLNNLKYGLVLLVLLVIIGAIYIKTDLFYANPSLALLGYHIYKVSGKFMGGEQRSLIVISREKLEINLKVHYKRLDDRIYYVKVNYDKG